jgi:hypothetical protein
MGNFLLHYFLGMVKPYLKILVNYFYFLAMYTQDDILLL